RLSDSLSDVSSLFFETVRFLWPDLRHYDTFSTAVTDRGRRFRWTSNDGYRPFCSHRLDRAPRHGSSRLTVWGPYSASTASSFRSCYNGRHRSRPLRRHPVAAQFACSRGRHPDLGHHILWRQAGASCYLPRHERRCLGGGLSPRVPL